MATNGGRAARPGDEELVDRLAETKDELFKLRFQHVTGQLDNTPGSRRCVKRDRPHRHRAAGPRDRRRRGADGSEEKA